MKTQFNLNGITVNVLTTVATSKAGTTYTNIQVLHGPDLGPKKVGEATIRHDDQGLADLRTIASAKFGDLCRNTSKSGKTYRTAKPTPGRGQTSVYVGHGAPLVMVTVWQAIKAQFKLALTETATTATTATTTETETATTTETETATTAETESPTQRWNRIPPSPLKERAAEMAKRTGAKLNSNVGCAAALATFDRLRRDADASVDTDADAATNDAADAATDSSDSDAAQIAAALRDAGFSAAEIVAALRTR